MSWLDLGDHYSSFGSGSAMLGASELRLQLIFASFPPSSIRYEFGMGASMAGSRHCNIDEAEAMSDDVVGTPPLVSVLC